MPTRRRSAVLGFTALLVTAFALAFAAPVRGQVVSDPRIAEFDPSPDHWTTLETGQQAVVRYELNMYSVGASTPFATVNMGRPDPQADGKIRYDFSTAAASWSFPGGEYEARVSAVGPEGAALSDPSNPFTFSTSSSCSVSLNTTTVRAVASGGSYSAQVSTGSTCSWTASTSMAWLTLWANSGTGSGSVPFQVQPNTSQFGRTGSIMIGGRTLTVAQDGASTTVTRTTPTITWPTPAPIVQGTALGSTQLNATASVQGTFAYSPGAGTVLAAGTHTLNTTFTPADATRYTTATASRTLVVNAPTTMPTITWQTPAAITEGTALNSTQLNATASVAGTIVYTPPAGTVLGAGTYTLTAFFTPSDRTRYSTTSASRNLTVNARQYRLTVTRPTGGMVFSAGISCGTTGTTCQVTMPGSMQMGVEAQPDSGYTFSGWTGDCRGTSAAFLLTLDGAKTCGATFTAVTTTPPPPTTSTPPPTTSTPPPPTGGTSLPIGAPYTLTVARPTGGVIRSAGITCGTGAASCQVMMPAAMTLGLDATADPGFVFAGWTGHCSGSAPTFVLALEGPRTCSASFNSTGTVVQPPATQPPPTGTLVMGSPYTLTVLPPTGGTVLAAGIKCGVQGTTCSVDMPAAMWIGLDASPAPGYTFVGWTGHCSGTQLTYALSLSGPRTCSATFAATTK